MAQAGVTAPTGGPRSLSPSLTRHLVGRFSDFPVDPELRPVADPNTRLAYHPTRSRPGFHVSPLAGLPGIGALGSCTVSSLPRFTRDEVATHMTQDDCWVIVGKLVFDVTEFVAGADHRGGRASILRNGGKDIGQHVQFHSDEMMRILKKFYVVGRLVDDDEDAASCVLQ